LLAGWLRSRDKAVNEDQPMTTLIGLLTIGILIFGIAYAVGIAINYVLP
jgi:hypothetical protein